MQISKCLAVLGLAAVLLALDGCETTTPAQQSSRFQSVVIGKWRDENVQRPGTDRVLWFGANGVVTDSWVFYGTDKCTAWATFKVSEYIPGTYVDLNFTHKVGACDELKLTSGSIKLDVRDSNHILVGNASFVRIQ
jgi:hypothetical protein